MSAEVLRQAAALMREEAHAVRRPFGREERVMTAVADWLDACAQFIEDEPGYTHDGEDYAMNVARAYLGGAS